MNEEIKLNNTKEGWDVVSPLGRIQKEDSVCTMCKFKESHRYRAYHNSLWVLVIRGSAFKFWNVKTTHL